MDDIATTVRKATVIQSVMQPNHRDVERKENHALVCWFW